MIYTATVAVDAGTSESNAVVTRLKLTKGLVYQVEFAFPPGPSGLLRVQVFDKAVQIWPSVRGEYFYGDSAVIAFQETYLINTEPFDLHIHTWNEDTVYEHALQVRIGLVSEDVFIARFLPEAGAEQIKAILESLVTDKQALQEQQAQQALAFLASTGG